MAASRTLLQLTQDILQSMQSDEITSISDTAESSAVAAIIRQTYWNLIGLEHLPEHNSLFKLTATSGSTPTLMTIPTNALRADWVKYNRETVDQTDDTFIKLEYIPIEEAYNRSHKLRVSADNVASFSYTFSPLGSDPVSWYYRTDVGPSWYTSPDDYNLLFDAVDTDLETYLTASRTLAWGPIDPTWTHTDGATPDLDAAQFALLFNEAKAQCFADLKQVGNARAEKLAKDLKINAQSNRARTEKTSPVYPSYGRK